MSNLLLLSFIFLILFVCYWFTRKIKANLNSRENYFLANRNISFLPLSMTFTATVLGGGLIIGAAQEAYTYGMKVFLYPIGSALGLIILGVGHGARLRAFKVSTIPELLGARFQSNFLMTLSGLISWVSLFTILIAQCIAARMLFKSLGLNFAFFAFIWIFLLSYTSRGGMDAVIKTDIVQATFMLIALFIVFILADFNLTEVVWRFTDQPNEEITKTPWLSWLIMPMAYAVVEQDLAQRCFSARNASVISMSSFFSGLIIVIATIVPISLGLLARQNGIIIASHESVLFLSISEILPNWAISLVTSTVLVAIISTSDSILNSLCSVTRTEFTFKGFQLKISFSTATVLVGVASIIISFFLNSIVSVLMLSYEISITCLFFPVLFAVYSKNPNTKAALLSVAGGSLGFILQFIISTPIPHEILGLLLSLLGYLFPLILSPIKKE